MHYHENLWKPPIFIVAILFSFNSVSENSNNTLYFVGFTKDGEHQSEMEDEPISIERKSIQCRLDFRKFSVLFCCYN